MKTERCIVPANALTFDAQLSNDEFAEAETTSLVLIARTSGVANHKYWGRCVHDFAGMLMPNERIPIDYVHDGVTVIGFAEKPEIRDGNLRLSATLVSTTEGDRAAEIRAKAAAGVPYQCSVAMTDFSVEQVPENLTAEANDQSYDGPLAIFRKWELRGVSICLHGCDRKTSLEFAELDGERLSVEVIRHDENLPLEIARQYHREFGELGSQYLLDGLELDEARTQFTADIIAENKRLTDQVAAMNAELQRARGESPVSFGCAVDTKLDATAGNDKFQDEFSHLPPGQAAYARACKLADQRAAQADAP